MRISRIALVVCALCLEGLPAHADNLLVNPGFETGDFTGWTVSGDSPIFGVATAGTPIRGTFNPTTVQVHSGNFAGFALVCANACLFSGHTDFLDLAQRVHLTPGIPYEVGIWIANGSGATFAEDVEFFVDGTKYVPTPSMAFGYLLREVTFTTPDPNPAIVFAIQGSGAHEAGFSFDDAFVTATPEPGCLLLIGTGLLGLAGSLRRRSFNRCLLNFLPWSFAVWGRATSR